MTLPYLRGFGDTLRDSLPSIGESLSKIVNPHQEDELRLKKLIAENPDLLDEYTQKELDNPGSLGAIFGKRASEYIRQQPHSAKYNEATKARELENTSRGLGIEGQRLNIAAATDSANKRDKAKEYVDKLRANPNTAHLADQIEAIGATNQELGASEADVLKLNNARKEADNITAAEDVAKGLPKDAGGIYKMLKDSSASVEQINAMHTLPEYTGVLNVVRQRLSEDAASRLENQRNRTEEGRNTRYFAGLDARAKADEDKRTKTESANIIKNNIAVSSNLKWLAGGIKGKPPSEEAAAPIIAATNTYLLDNQTKGQPFRRAVYITDLTKKSILGIPTGHKGGVVMVDENNQYVPSDMKANISPASSPSPSPSSPSDNSTSGPPDIKDQEMIKAINSSSKVDIETFKVNYPEAWNRISKWVKLNDNSITKTR